MGTALPRAPSPTPAGALGLTAPGGLLCREGEATGLFVPAPNGGLYPRHRAQTPIGGSPPPPPPHKTLRWEGLAPGNGLPKAKGGCRPPGPPWPPASSSYSSPGPSRPTVPRGG